MDAIAALVGGTAAMVDREVPDEPVARPGAGHHGPMAFSDATWLTSTAAGGAGFRGPAA